MFGKIATGIGAVIFATLMAIFVLPRHQTWSPDGIIYSQMMLEDVGLKDRDAQLVVRSFYSAKPLAQNRLYQNLLTDHPQESFRNLRTLFRPRVVYPYLASLMYPRLGFMALVYVSLAAYVLGVVSVYILVACFSPSWVAFLAACIFGLNSEIRSLGAAALTDMLAVAFWTAALACLAIYAQRYSERLLFLYAFITVVLVLTRPVLYLPLGASLGVFLSYWARYGAKDLRTRKIFLSVLATVLAGLALAIIISITDADSVDAVRWGYERSIELGQNPGPNFDHWFLLSLAQSLRSAFADLIVTGAILGAVVILAKLWDIGDSVAPLLAGALTASVIGVILNPIPSDLSRVIEAPLWPVIVAGYALALNALVKRTQRFNQGSAA